MALDETLHLRLGGQDLARLDALARRLPGGRRTPLARELLLAGLEAAERDPASLVRAAAAVPEPPVDVLASDLP